MQQSQYRLAAANSTNIFGSDNAGNAHNNKQSICQQNPNAVACWFKKQLNH